MAIRIYIAPQIGSGTFQDPYRSLLNNFIDVSQGDWFDEIDNPATRHSICTVHASQATHDKIYADRLTNPGRIVYLSTLAPDDATKCVVLQSTWLSFPLVFRKAAAAMLMKAANITDTDLSNAVTLKDVLRGLIHRNFTQQRLAAFEEVPSKWGTFKFAGEDW